MLEYSCEWDGMCRIILFETVQLSFWRIKQRRSQLLHFFMAILVHFVTDLLLDRVLSIKVLTFSFDL